jgi:hypothetical protein
MLLVVKATCCTEFFILAADTQLKAVTCNVAAQISRGYSSGMLEMKMDWSYSVYGNGTKEIPYDMPTPLSKAVTLTCFVDANLMHDFVTGRSTTGVLHLMNSTPIDWFSKRQDTVETVTTYGSEFVAARIATEQTMEIRITLRYMGVPEKDQSYLVFGDNEGVIKSSTSPHLVLRRGIIC